MTNAFFQCLSLLSVRWLKMYNAYIAYSIMIFPYVSEAFSWELRTLRYLVAIADAGTITAAANAIHISQPALSRQMQELETELGTKLFNRKVGQ